MFKWRVSFCENEKCKDINVRSGKDAERLGYPTIDARVPGDLLLDMTGAGLLPDLFYSCNTLEALKYENLHAFYFTEFDVADTASYIRFDGVDTVADIYVNGEFICSHDNMFTGFDISSASLSLALTQKGKKRAFRSHKARRYRGEENGTSARAHCDTV